MHSLQPQVTNSKLHETISMNMSHMSVLVSVSVHTNQCVCSDNRISNCITAVLWLNSSVLEQQTKTKQNSKSQSGHIVLFIPFHLFNLIHVLVQVTHTKLILYSTHWPFLHCFWHVLSFVCDWIQILMLNITPYVNGLLSKSQSVIEDFATVR